MNGRRLTACLVAMSFPWLAYAIVRGDHEAADRQANQVARAETDRVALALEQKLRNSTAQLALVVQQAATAPQLPAILATDDANTLKDFMSNEQGWEPFRVMGNTGVFVDGRLVACTGGDPDLVAGLEALGGAPGQAIIERPTGGVLLTASALVTTTNAGRTLVVVAAPLPSEPMQAAAVEAHAVFAIRAERSEAFSVKSSQPALDALLEAPPSGPCCAERSLAPGLSLRVARVVEPPTRSKSVLVLSFALALLMSAAALAWGFARRTPTNAQPL